MIETCLEWKLTNKFRFQFTSCLRESIPEEERKLVIYDLICKKKLLQEIGNGYVGSIWSRWVKNFTNSTKRSECETRWCEPWLLACYNWLLMQSKLLATSTSSTQLFWWWWWQRSWLTQLDDISCFSSLFLLETSHLQSLNTTHPEWIWLVNKVSHIFFASMVLDECSF